MKKIWRLTILISIAIVLAILYWYFYIYNPTDNIAYWPNWQIRHIYHESYWWRLNWEQIDYYENGQIYRIMHFKDGQQHWEYISYYENGQIADIRHFDHSESVGESISYRPTWELIWKWNYVDWLPVDWEYIERYENWDIRRKVTYKDWKVDWYDIRYDRNGDISFKYDADWNTVYNKYDEWKNSEILLEPNTLTVNENEILSTDELKKACEKVLWWEKSKDIVTTWTDEKLFINTYSFKGITETDWINTVYCNVTLDWVVLDAAFYLDEWQTIEELHKQLDYTPWSSYPNLKEYYWFVWTIVLWNRLQTTYITWKNIMYFDNTRWIALKLWDIPDWGLIREIDTDEGWIPRSEIIFLIKGEENEENRTWINWYREMFTIVAISKEILENFWASLHDLPFKYVTIWENNQYYFVETNIEWNYSDLQIFDIEDKF